MMRPEQWSILYYAMSEGTQDTTKTTDTDRYRMQNNKDVFDISKNYSRLDSRGQDF